MCRRQAEPFEVFGEVLLNADATGIENAQIELAIGNAAIGRFFEPLRGAGVIRTFAAAVGIEHRQIVHGLGVSALSGLQIISSCDVDVLCHAQAFFVERAQPEDRRHYSGLCRAVVPFRGFVVVGRDSLAFGKAPRDFISRRRVALQRGCAQGRSADAVGQSLRRRDLNQTNSTPSRMCLRDRDRAGNIARGQRRRDE